MTTQLYLLTPPQIDLNRYPDQLKAALDTSTIPVLQLRLKGAEEAEILRAGEKLMPIAHAYDCAFLVNDRADLAAKLGADGVHLGQRDGSVADARALLGHDAQIGVTCHASKDLAFEAGEAGADYVAFGAFFPTATKQVTHHADIPLIEDWVEIAEIPCVAIGGITPDNCAPLVATGADFLAVSSAVWDHEAGPVAAIAAFQTIFMQTQSKPD